jgi:hypothetical protein
MFQSPTKATKDQPESEKVPKKEKMIISIVKSYKWKINKMVHLLILNRTAVI